MKLLYDGSEREVEIIQTDPNDGYQPFLFQFEDTGECVWIPREQLPPDLQHLGDSLQETRPAKTGRVKK